MDKTAFLQRVGEMLLEEQKQPEGWWYLSFAGAEGFRGAALVRGRGIVSADLTAKSHGVDPGGELLAIPISPGSPLPEYRFRNRLLSLADLREAFQDGVVDLRTGEIG